jgi:hypothetical protein
MYVERDDATGDQVVRVREQIDLSRLASASSLATWCTICDRPSITLRMPWRRSSARRSRF